MTRQRSRCKPEASWVSQASVRLSPTKKGSFQNFLRMKTNQKSHLTKGQPLCADWQRKKKIGVTAEEHNKKKKNRITGSARKTSVLGTKANKIGFVAKLKKVANSITDEKDSLDDFQVNITERPKPQKPSALSSLKSTWGCGTNAPNQPSAAIGRPPNSPSKTPKMWPSDEGRDSLTDYDDEEIGKVGI